MTEAAKSESKILNLFQLAPLEARSKFCHRLQQLGLGQRRTWPQHGAEKPKPRHVKIVCALATTKSVQSVHMCSERPTKILATIIHLSLSLATPISFPKQLGNYCCLQKIKKSVKTQRLRRHVTKTCDLSVWYKRRNTSAKGSRPKINYAAAIVYGVRGALHRHCPPAFQATTLSASQAQLLSLFCVSRQVRRRNTHTHTAYLKGREER